MPKRHRCQVLVIGSGPGGAVTADILSSYGKDVIMLEEGPHLPLDSCEPFSIAEMRQKYRCGGLNPALGAPKVPLVEGCCVGGGSEINSGLYHRTHLDVLRVWRARYQVRHLEHEDLVPHYEACESALSVQLNPGPVPAPAAKMKLGADRLGWQNREVPRWFKYPAENGSNGSPVGKRQSMTETLIPRAQRAGCRLMPGVRAERLRHGRNGAWNVSAAGPGGPIEFEADAVFVCGGAIQTPALLRRSGIARNVGRSLALHPTVKVVAFFEDEVNGQPGIPAHQVTEFSPLVGIGCSISSLPYIALAGVTWPSTMPWLLDLRAGSCATCHSQTRRSCNTASNLLICGIFPPPYAICANSCWLRAPPVYTPASLDTASLVARTTCAAFPPNCPDSPPI